MMSAIDTDAPVAETDVMAPVKSNVCVLGTGAGSPGEPKARAALPSDARLLYATESAPLVIDNWSTPTRLPLTCALTEYHLRPVESTKIAAARSVIVALKPACALVP